MNVAITIGLLTLIVSCFLITFFIVTFEPTPKNKAKNYDKKDTK
jgi:hypothetical protein|tara:strand:- start:2014 stop:2145 length:132 start_codon:yes stop_codon:yes gene_type:complete